jgi:mannitol operon repressor
MVDDPPDDRRRVPFEESHPHLKEFAAFLPELNKETDRGMALIATSFIDELLKRVLLAFFLEGETSASLVEGFNAPLGTFSTRIAAAAALALISETECSEANYLRKIRNLFAHNVHVSFSDKHVIDMCRNLRMAAPDYGNVIVNSRGQFST